MISDFCTTTDSKLHGHCHNKRSLVSKGVKSHLRGEKSFHEDNKLEILVRVQKIRYHNDVKFF